MSTELSLPLKNLRLSYAKENLRLFITPILEVSCVAGMLDNLQPSDIFRALKSGCIWLSRGVGCQINIRLSFNGTSFDSVSHENNPIEDLATLIREADLWNQLSLSPSLEIPNRQDARMDSDIRFNISYAHPPQNLLEAATSLSVIPADTKPPDGVPHVGLNSLELLLDFCSFRKSPVKSRKRKRLAEESMLLDHPDFTARDQSIQLDDLQTETTAAVFFGSSQLDQACVMKTSYEQTQDTSVSFQKDEEGDEDALLLDTNPTQLLTPPSSAPQSSSSIISKRPAEGTEVLETIDSDLSMNLDLPVAMKLTDVGLRTLIGGRQMKATPGVTLLKPDQEHTLSDLAPSLWSPGYLKAVSQRSRFLPIISRSLSTSLLKHTQSSSVRRKLSDLANLQASPSELPETSDVRSKSINREISRIVQARVWKMAQKSLIDPQAARRLHSILKLPNGTRRKPRNVDLLAEESGTGDSATFSYLADDLAGFAEEEEFEDFFGDEGFFPQDLAESEEFQVFQEPMGKCYSDKAACKLKPDEADIPDEFWEDLRLEEECDEYRDEALLVPEEFWDDLLMEERERVMVGIENSSMLI